MRRSNIHTIKPVDPYNAQDSLADKNINNAYTDDMRFQKEPKEEIREDRKNYRKINIRRYNDQVEQKIQGIQVK